MKLRVAASLRSGAHAQGAGASGLCSSLGWGRGEGRGGGGADLFSYIYSFSLACLLMTCSFIHLLIILYRFFACFLQVYTWIQALCWVLGINMSIGNLVSLLEELRIY